MSSVWLLLIPLGFVAGGMSAVLGTGASLMLLPILVPTFGAVEAIPIMAIAGFMANFARTLTWWREIDWRSVAVYGVPGALTAILGAYTLVSLPQGISEMLLGLFVIALVPLRRFWLGSIQGIGLPHLAASGALVGYLTGIFLSTGPLSIQAFMSYGLSRGGLIATEAAASLLLQTSKLASFRSLGALPLDIILAGLALGSTLMLGTLAIKSLISRMENKHFRALMDVVTLASGLWLLIFGLSRL